MQVPQISLEDTEAPRIRDVKFRSADLWDSKKKINEQIETPVVAQQVAVNEKEKQENTSNQRQQQPASDAKSKQVATDYIKQEQQLVRTEKASFKQSLNIRTGGENMEKTKSIHVQEKNISLNKPEVALQEEVKKV